MKNLTSEQKEIILKGLRARREELVIQAWSSHRSGSIGWIMSGQFQNESYVRQIERQIELIQAL